MKIVTVRKKKKDIQDLFSVIRSLYNIVAKYNKDQ